MRDLARRQHGVVGRRQVWSLGASRGALRARLGSPGWEAVTPHVLRLVGTPTSFAQRCMIAVLDDAGPAVVSRTAAAALWKLPGFKEDRVHVTKASVASSRVAEGGSGHESRLLPPHHCTVLDGIPVTTVARTLFDLAGCVHPLRTERALDNALALELVELEAMRAVAVELLRRGRTGSALMRRLLAARGAGYIPPASGLEALLLAILAAAGVELPEGQVELGGSEWIGRVDFFYRLLRLVIEVDSERHHSAKLDREADARRDAALRAAGYAVLRITERQLKEHPHEVVALVLEARARRLSELRPAN